MIDSNTLMHCLQFDVNMLLLIDVCVRVRCTYMCIYKAFVLVNAVYVYLYPTRKYFFVSRSCVCVHLFTIQIRYVYCCLHCLYTKHTACCLAATYERAVCVPVYLPLPPSTSSSLLFVAVHIDDDVTDDE